MAIEPLPSTGISKILGLCEILDDHGGKEDIYRLTRDLHMPFGELLLVMKGAEMLELVDVLRADATLTALGKQALTGSMGDKKALMQAQMLKLNVFQHVRKRLASAEKNEVPAGVIVEELAMLLPQEQPRQLFTTLLNWGRYGEIFGYARETDLFFLQKPVTP